ncbi:MAG: MarR family winged helix-turn-helix transcriptional regulator [Kofleriaceae bacterium]
MDDAAQFAELFPALYLRLHRRDRKRDEMTGATRAALLHLANTGPLAIGEIARHFDRAQSVVSEIVDGLERKGWLERIRDPRDGRRTLVWLTEDGLAALDRERQVLSAERVARAMAAMTAADRAALLRGMRALVQAADQLTEEDRHE